MPFAQLGFNLSSQPGSEPLICGGYGVFLRYFLPLDLLRKLYGRLSKFKGEGASCFFTSMSSCAGPGNVFC